MKECPRCGNPNDDSVRFCAVCQQRFGAPVEPVAPKPPSARPVVPPRPPQDSTPPPKNTAPEQSPALTPPRAAPARGGTTFSRVPAFESPTASPPPSATAGRKIVGILIIYSWKPEGQIFPICEGRNLIGRDPNQCEIAIPEDSSLSSRNTIITYRSGFRIADDDSMSGTYLDGEALELRESRRLENYSTIRTGSTDWLFIAIEPTESNP